MLRGGSIAMPREGKEISLIFEKYGEEYFRKLESEVISEVSDKSGVIISTGGGAILNPKNIDNLKMNGKVYFIDRSLDNLICTDDRPLSSNVELLKKRYEERYDKYLKYCDVRVKNNQDIKSAIDKIMEI